MNLSALGQRLGNKTVVLQDVSKGYDGKILFSHLTYVFDREERLGIVGPNGCGKTTLLRVLMGLEAPDTGSVELGTTVKIGYFSQENDELPGDSRVIDAVRDVAEYVKTKQGTISASKMLERFLFPEQMQYSQINRLSGGEKRRLSLLLVLMRQPNLLVLDEPTNDLDIQTLSILEAFLTEEFSGMVVSVSHDRYFLDKTANRILAFRPDGTLMQSEGGFSDYWQRRQEMMLRGEWPEACGQDFSAEKESGEQDLLAGEESAAQKDSSGGGTGDWISSSEERSGLKCRTTEEEYRAQVRAARKKRGFSYKEQKEYDTIGEEISDLEERIAALEQEMGVYATDYEKLAALTREKEEAEQTLEAKMERWMELEEMQEEFQRES